MLLEWLKDTTIKGLELMGGVGWEAKRNYIILICIVNKMLIVATVTIKQVGGV